MKRDSASDDTGTDLLRDLPEESTTESADSVKGGAAPSGPDPIPIPYPNLKPVSPRGSIPGV